MAEPDGADGAVVGTWTWPSVICVTPVTEVGTTGWPSDFCEIGLSGVVDGVGAGDVGVSGTAGGVDAGVSGVTGGLDVTMTGTDFVDT